MIAIGFLHAAPAGTRSHCCPGTPLTNLPSPSLAPDQGTRAFGAGQRLLQLCEVIRDRYDDQVGLIGRRFAAYPELHAALDALPGWGPVTIRLFLRELRGVWPGAGPPLDERAATAARHLGLASARPGVSGLAGLAAACGLDVRDLESSLVRLDLAHGRAMAGCPGGPACTALRQPVPQGAS